MRSAKDLVVLPISGTDARRVVRSIHYSGKVANNSQINLGVFLDGKCCGAMQFGPPMDRSKILPMVAGSKWTDVLELNRMAFSDALPRNSESRALGVALRMLRKRYPHIKWVVSFADGTQCGDGTIYRASGFVLTGISPAKQLVRLPTGEVVHKMVLGSGPTKPRRELGGRSAADVSGNGGYSFSAYCREAGAVVLTGFQLRYVYFLDPSARARLTVPEVPFSRIAELGASMYKGVRMKDSAPEA